MKAIGYVRVSTEKEADFGVSLEAESEKVRAMAVVQAAELAEIIIDAGESAEAKTFNNRWSLYSFHYTGLGCANSVIRKTTELFGRRGWTRTSDPQLRRLMLYPPELRARVSQRV
jgi:hypothetical protein